MRSRRGKLDEAGRQTILDGVVTTTDPSALADVDLLIEAVPENLALSSRCCRVGRHHPAGAIFASNTSALRITELAVATARPSRVIGMHFFNPAPVLDLVELVSTIASDAAVVQEAREFLDHIGRSVVEVNDRPDSSPTRCCSAT